MRYLFGLLVILLALPAVASAHVRYVIDDAEYLKHAGVDVSFLMTALQDLNNVALVLAAIGVVAIIYVLFSVVPFLVRLRAHVNERADSYLEFIPWIVRLSLGIALIGAGSAEVFISPALATPSTVIAFIEVLIGFLILAGFLVVPSALALILLYIVAVFTDPYLIGNIEVLAGAIVLLLLDNERPGMDDLVGIPKMSPFKRFERYVPLVLRVGLGIAMIYLAVYEKFLNPNVSALVVDIYSLQSAIPVNEATWVLGAGVVELLIGLLLLIGLRVRLLVIITFFVLSTTFFYFGEEVYSHITLFGLLSALFVTRGGFLSIDHHFGIDNKLELQEERLPPDEGIL